MPKHEYDLFVGSYGDSSEELIHWLKFDAKKGELTPFSSVSGVENPSFVTLNGARNRLYAVSETESGEVVSFDVDHEAGTLKELNRQSTSGWAPCFIELHENDRFLFTANFGGGNVLVHPIAENGWIEPASDVLEYSQRAEELGLQSHPHAIRNIPNTNKFIVTDLGLNRLFLYAFKLDTGCLDFVKEIVAPDGSGPRHIAFHPTLSNFYIVNELNSTVNVYAHDESAERIELLQTVKTIPDGYEWENYCADIHVSSSGAFLFASNRGHHTIATYRVMEDGTLQPVTQTPCAGEWPRNFAVVPGDEYVLVANEHTNSIVVMKVNEDGELQATNQLISIKRPVCLKVLSPKVMS